MQKLFSRDASILCAALGGALVFLAPACGGDDATIGTSPNPDASTGDGATGDGALGDGALGDGGCDRTKSPRDDACVVSDDVGVFVAPSGDDAAQGTKAAPFKTIARGIQAAKQAAKRVYVCAATYDEKVVIDTSADGVSLFGGLACPAASTDGGADAGDAGPAAAAWSYTGSRATVAPSTAGVPLTLDSLMKRTSIEDFELDAHDGVAAGDSSVAAFVKASGAVTLRRVKLVAGAGKKGKDADPVTGAPATTDSGSTNIGGTGGVAKMCSCANGGTTTGGKGGDANVTAPTAGDPGLPNLGGMSPNDGAGGAGGCASGHGGASAAKGAGGAGAANVGALGAAGWSPAAGAKGASGTPGQGGGGGGGATISGGGGGGCGGCGGLGGSGGGGGGGSIAIASVMSTVTLDACTLVAGAGGAGGGGGAGQGGGAGGGSGSGSCQGGAGGAGGAGGGGGGGAGGVSIAIAFVGTQPTQANGTTTAIGAFGQGGAGGVGSGSNGMNGTNGVAVATQSF